MMYPQRPPEFFTDFLTAMVKRGVASAYGAQAFSLLVAIVLEERREGFRIAARFRDSDVKLAAGIRGHRHLWSIRRHLVAGGWLHYVPGNPARPACYWVLLPEPQPSTSARKSTWDLSQVSSERGNRSA